MKGKKKPARRKASKAQTELRLREIVRIRLDGAKVWDVTESVAEQEQTDGSPWKLARGETPLSRRQIERYLERADRLIVESTRESRKRSLRRHLARRENLLVTVLKAFQATFRLYLNSEYSLDGFNLFSISWILLMYTCDSLELVSR
ncbi:MAG: hypothetical protein HYS12_02160, partial [Planctomycetes bacterium]|nr:hypothetical protein [Planctomycetota bacterium]